MNLLVNAAEALERGPERETTDIRVRAGQQNGRVLVTFLDLDLLSAFFIAYHHGGDISVHKTPPEGPGFEVVIPLDPETAQRPALENDFMERVFFHYDMWDSFEPF